MKKKLNGKIKSIRKNAITIIVILILILFTSLSLAILNRNYMFIENVFKGFLSYTNTSLTKNSYKCKMKENYFIDNKVKYLEKENKELRNILDLKINNKNYKVTEVINHIQNNFFNILEINKGTRKKIKKEDPVINTLGLVGFISKTGKNVSEVKLLTNVNSNDLVSVIIKTESSDVSGVLSSYDEKKNLFKVSDVMSKNNIKKGDKVVLSGYGNFLYKGLYIGDVVKEKSSNYGLTKNIWIKSHVNFDDISFLVVIKEDI